MTFSAVDVHGFGGGFTLGTVQAGFELKAKMSREIGFGVYACLANRQLLGNGWDSITGGTENGYPSPQWERLKGIDLVFGNPPCSGFSTMSRKEFRGMNSSINNYMWELIRYAAEIKPQIVAWESVQQTFRQGLPLMRQLHEELEEVSGLKYHLYHVLHNNASVGGVSIRKRYFWVASQIPFGVSHDPVSPDGTDRALTTVPTLDDMLIDLENLGLTMNEQPYRGVQHIHLCSEGECEEECENFMTLVNHSSEWTRREIHDGTGYVDGHQVARSPSLARAEELLWAEPWHEGERMDVVLRRLYQRTGKLTDGWNYYTTRPDGTKCLKAERLIETDFAMGHNQIVRWRGYRPAYVITGGAVHLILHPRLPRTLTQREAARIQGFPDAWKIWPVRHAADLGPAWGKGVPVQAGRWIASQAHRALAGSPGGDSGRPLAGKLLKQFGPKDRESVIDITSNYLPFLQPDPLDTVPEDELLLS